MDCLSPGGAAEAVRRGHSSPSSSDDLDWMTQSQFAQVVFHDVAAWATGFSLLEILTNWPRSEVNTLRESGSLLFNI
jgi:hypothetical protein